MKAIETLRTEFPDNWITEDDFVNNPPKPTPEELLFVPIKGGFHTQHEISADADPETEVERIVRSLFDASPKAKVFRVTFDPSFGDLAEGHIGGTITISGVF